MNTKQVNKDAYEFHRYAAPDRFGSYYYQLDEIFRTESESVLEIGVGDGVVREYLRGHSDISYRSLDIAADLEPDIVGSVLAIPLPDNSVDTVFAFEVLEHLPFVDFPRAIEEMTRVARKHVLVSFPHFGPPLKFLLKIPLLPEIRFAIKFPFPKTHVWNGQHYWEIGKKDYPSSRIREIIGKVLTIDREYVPWENQYHHFFICRKP